MLREKQELHEKWVEIERKLEKIQHEFSVKEAQNRAMQVMCLYPRTKSYYLFDNIGFYITIICSNLRLSSFSGWVDPAQKLESLYANWHFNCTAYTAESEFGA